MVVGGARTATAAALRVVAGAARAGVRLGAQLLEHGARAPDLVEGLRPHVAGFLGHVGAGAHDALAADDAVREGRQAAALEAGVDAQLLRDARELGRARGLHVDGHLRRLRHDVVQQLLVIQHLERRLLDELAATHGDEEEHVVGHRADLDGEVRADAWAKEAVRMALVNLSAVAAPAGTMPVVLGAGWPGVLLHEAVGHGLEGDFNRRGTSVFSGQVGELVASELCTVVDDGTMVDRRGSVAIDDEGTPGQYNVLIENGILKGYMQDKLNARLMGMTPTGNGRRESYAHLPMPRMTNTYMLPGKSTPQEIIESVEYGIYAPNFGGGQVDITSGKFVFSTSEAYLIENGKVTKPVKGATLIGSGIETMQQISMVGNDLKLDNGVGVCGKEGQSLPVGVGQPTLKVDNLTVGGTA